MGKTKLLFDEKFVAAAVALIKAAKKEVFVIAYLMADPGKKKPGREELLYREVFKVIKRGVGCRVIINYARPESKMVKQNVGAVRYMTERGAKCKAVSRNRTVHAKMIIIDGVSLIMGSHNWTARAMERNIEASIQVGDKEVVKVAREKFMELWEEAKEI